MTYQMICCTNDTPDLGFNDGQVTLNQGKVEFFYGTIMPLHHVNYRAAS